MRCFLCICLLGMTSLLLSAKTTAQEIILQDQLERLLDKAEQATLQYSETFRNLSAEETKIFQDYRKDGSFGEKRIIKSNFIIYQSPRNNKATEFRYVLEYNGKPVEENHQKISGFFAELEKAANDEDEAVRLKNESVRFDGKTNTWGFTLRQPSPLGKLRPFFEFKVLNRERIEGVEVVVIQYHQKSPSPLILVNPVRGEYSNDPERSQYNLNISPAFRPTNPFWEGTLWLNAKTGQIMRNEFKVLLHPPQLSKPVVCLEFFHEYQPSGYKILVPKKFKVLIYKIWGTNDENVRAVKQREMAFEFSKFSEFKTETFRTEDANR